MGRESGKDPGSWWGLGREEVGEDLARVTPIRGFCLPPLQRGNPVLKFVRNVPWEFGEVIPDYVLGQSTCALFLR